ncbi:MAG TPA: methyltransferase domain-containing protein [Thermoanaerobaculia bacterium]|nr:methyltransferase domain-containing protein [Thermoanaerobaculia bacterium]
MSRSLSRRGRWGIGILAVLTAGGAVLLLYQRKEQAAEIDRLVETLELEAGSRLADVGAGKGRVAFALAERVGPGGQVLATEIDAKRLRQMRDTIERRRIENVTVVEAGETETGLADACCEAAYLRDVYHHLGDPAAIDASLFRAIRPGGRLVVIDFEPSWFLSRLFPVEHAPANRGGHGVSPEIVIGELTAAGFELERRIDEWGFGSFAVVFRRP